MWSLIGWLHQKPADFVCTVYQRFYKILKKVIYIYSALMSNTDMIYFFLAGASPPKPRDPGNITIYSTSVKQKF